MNSQVSDENKCKQAAEEDRRERILEQGNRGYAALRADPEAWAELQAERDAWDYTLSDGLEEED